MIVAIIQARMGSSRLSRKIMLDVCGKTFLEHMIDRVAQSKTLDKIIIATSLNKDDDIIEDFCKKKKISPAFVVQRMMCCLDTKWQRMKLKQILSLG